jgi:hypothetical protein
MRGLKTSNGRTDFLPNRGCSPRVATKLRCLGLCKVEMSLGRLTSVAGEVERLE